METSRIYKKIFNLILACFVVTACSSKPPRDESAKLPVRYSYLKILDLDQMTGLMQDKAREYRQGENSQNLKDALLLCLARPDEDALIEKTIGIVKTPLEDSGLWESSVEELVEQSLAGLKEAKIGAVDQVTYSVVLENILSEFKPQFIKQYKSPGFETKMIEKIAAADVELSFEAKNERKLNLMKSGFSPSQVARRMIEHKKEFLDKEKSK